MVGQSVISLALALGAYTGQGTWYDSASVTHNYEIQMRLEQLSTGVIRQWFKHIFIEENGSVIEQTLDWIPTQNGIFEVQLVGTNIKGRGYCSKSACHYSLPVPQNLVEGTLIFSSSGALESIVGSAEKNSQGNYIWWEEKVEVTRVGSS